MQFNKQDAPGAMPVAAMRTILRIGPSIPTYPAAAVKGDGVVDTLRAVINSVIRHFQQQMTAHAA